MFLSRHSHHYLHIYAEDNSSAVREVPLPELICSDISTATGTDLQ